MKLMEVGVQVELYNYPGTVHGFDFITMSDISIYSITKGINVFKRAVMG